MFGHHLEKLFKKEKYYTFYDSQYSTPAEYRCSTLLSFIGKNELDKLNNTNLQKDRCHCQYTHCACRRSDGQADWA